MAEFLLNNNRLLTNLQDVHHLHLYSCSVCRWLPKRKGNWGVLCNQMWKIFGQPTMNLQRSSQTHHRRWELITCHQVLRYFQITNTIQRLENMGPSLVVIHLFVWSQLVDRLDKIAKEKVRLRKTKRVCEGRRTKIAASFVSWKIRELFLQQSLGNDNNSPCLL